MKRWKTDGSLPAGHYNLVDEGEEGEMCFLYAQVELVPGKAPRVLTWWRPNVEDINSLLELVNEEIRNEENQGRYTP